MLKKNSNFFLAAQVVFDALLVFICWMGAYYIRFERMSDAQEGLLPLFLNLSPAIILITLYAFYRNNLYRSQRFNNRYVEILTVGKANTFATLTMVIFLYFYADERLSRIAIGAYYITSTFVLTLFRILVRNFLRILRRKGYNLRHILLVGHGPQVKNYIHTVKAFKDAGLRITAWIDNGGMAPEFDLQSSDLSVKEAIETFQPDSVIIGYSGKDSDMVEEILKENYDTLTTLQVLPDLSYSFIGHQVEDFAGVPLLSVNHHQLGFTESMLKRLVDFLISFFGLIIVSPLFLVIGIVTKITSPGPIFYGQERMGLDGQMFKMWKFRTMHQPRDGEDKTSWSSENDPRKTKFGNLLRKTSLDELPQLWNVLVGDMSIVGPRPERPFFVDKFRTEIPAYMLRHKMKAGITGWAQINGWRGDTSLHKRIECDIYYIKHWSLWLDFKIIVLTFWKGFFNKNAY